MPLCQMSDRAVEVVDDEDAMGAALSELREARAPDAASEPAVVETSAAAEPEQAAEPEAKEPEPETPEVKLARTQAELHKAQSDLGRVSALNRANQEKAQEIDRLRRQLAEATKPPETAAQAGAELAALAEQVKDFPELASLVDVVGKALAEVETRSQASAKQAAQDAIAPLEPLRKRHLDEQTKQQEAATAADLDVFNSTYPDARDVVSSNEFKEWLPKQSQAVQWAFFKGETPADAMPVMDAYDAYLRRSGKPSIARTPEPTRTPQAQEPARTGSSRLERAAGIPSRAGSAAAKGGLPPADDFEGSLEFFRKRRQANAYAGAA